mmetsp:Transcript_7483/g.14721  ORF Transcript_7483/g.14721 Transcript_7483/m.14721 type:complete len:344 (-) Transcript_7483:231-1262(-)
MHNPNEVKGHIPLQYNGEPLPLNISYRRGETNVEVIIPPEYMVKDSKREKGRQLWGDLIYTADSDLVAVLVHEGYYAHFTSQPPLPVPIKEFRALLKLLPDQEKYVSKTRFLKSRSWGSKSLGCSFQVRNCIVIMRNELVIELHPILSDAPSVQPTVQPALLDRQISTRTANANTKSRISQDVFIQFNLCNEPWLKYSIATVSDQGLKPHEWTSIRLRNEVIFLETTSERFQLSYARTIEDPEKEPAGIKDVYNFSKCLEIFPAGLLTNIVGLPMPNNFLQVLHEDLDWDDIKWGTSFVYVKDQQFAVRRIHFMPISRPKMIATETVREEESVVGMAAMATLA